jgi:putative Mn2+ efflux pump MntP
MSFGAIVVLALGVAMDAAAVSAVRGLAVPAIRPSHCLRVALFFGGFQALMPAIGWALGAAVGPAIGAWDHWVAFALLSGIGGRMLWDARRDADDDAPTGDPFATRAMLGLAIATSIDALAVGVTLPMIGAPPALSIATIGVVTALLSIAGLFAGRAFGAVLGRRLDAVGGVVLIALGVKTLVGHLSA